MIIIALLSRAEEDEQTESEAHVGYFYQIQKCTQDQFAWLRAELMKLCQTLNGDFRSQDLRVFGSRIQITGEIEFVELLRKTKDFGFILRKVSRAKHAAVPKMASTCT